jgi:hypothetical protein
MLSGISTHTHAPVGRRTSFKRSASGYGRNSRGPWDAVVVGLISGTRVTYTAFPEQGLFTTACAVSVEVKLRIAGQWSSEGTTESACEVDTSGAMQLTASACSESRLRAAVGEPVETGVLSPRREPDLRSRANDKSTILAPCRDENLYVAHPSSNTAKGVYTRSWCCVCHYTEVWQA